MEATPDQSILAELAITRERLAYLEREAAKLPVTPAPMPVNARPPTPPRLRREPPQAVSDEGYEVVQPPSGRR